MREGEEDGAEGAYDDRVRRVRTRLVAAQTALRRSKGAAFAVFLSGDDRRGIHRLANRLFEWMDARLVHGRVHGRPRGRMRRMPVLTRMWRDCPQKGGGALFIRPAPTQILTDHLRGRTGRKRFEGQLDQLRRMDTMWALEGVKMIKLWLTLPEEDHARRRRSLTDLDRWRHKQSDQDLIRDLARGGRVSTTLRERTTHPHASWTVLDGADRKERDLRGAEAVADALEEAVAGETHAPVEFSPEAVSPKAAERTAALFAHASLGVEAPGEKEYKHRIDELRGDITENALRALRDKRSTVIALEGWDAAGKGGAIRRALPALDLGFCAVASTAAPNEAERAHPYLWRFWRDLPRPGHVRFFDRTWYGRVLVERVEGFADEATWGRAYDEIVDFERQIADSGARVVKVWLEVSPEEQLRRFEARQALPEKHYKITDEDWRNREKRPAYEEAVREMIARTSKKFAPWHVVSAENKRAARLRFLEILRDALESFGGARSSPSRDRRERGAEEDSRCAGGCPAAPPRILSLDMRLPRPSNVVLLTCLLAPGCDEPEFQAPPPPPVVVAEPRVEDVTRYEILSGRTEPVETVEVRARVEGVLLEIAHAEGLFVKEGDLMFRIDPEPFVAARDSATAQVTAAEAQAELADITATKLEAAFAENAVSELQALEARAQHKVAVQEVEVARKNEAIRELEVDYTEIAAPISGRVEYSPFFVGSLVGGLGSSALTRIMNDSTVRVWFTVPDRVALQFIDDERTPLDEDGAGGAVVDGVSVQVGRDSDEGYPFTGQIDYADPTVDIETGTIRARAVVDNADRRLVGGLFVRVRIEAGVIEDAIVVPEVSVNTDQQGKFIYVVGDGDIVERRNVKLGPLAEDGIVVLEGIGAGDRVVVAGQLSARPGAKVAPRPADAPQG